MKSSFTKKLLAMLTAVMLLFSIVGISTIGSAASYDKTGATTFTFSDSGISVKDGTYTGYKVEGTALTINDSGTYVVTGTCADGSVTVKKGTTGVTLILSDLNLTSSDTAPISCNKSTEVTVVAEGTNTLTDSEKNNDETYPDNTNAENAVIKCKDGSKVTLTGTGILNIVSNGKNGLKGGATTEEEGEASLTIENLTLNITANVNDGLKADNGLFIKSGNITVSAADDAIKSDYDLTIGEEGSNGPTIRITKSTEGIEAATLAIHSGDISVTASDDGMNAANSDLGNYNFSLTINGGKVYVNSDGDGIDSNGSLTINGGYVEVYAANQSDNSPYDADGALSINGGTVVGVGHSGMTRGASGSQNSVTFGAGGMGGFGGRGGMGNFGARGNMMQNGEMPTDGTRPDFPQGEMPNFQNGEQPQMPNGNMQGGRGNRGNMGNMQSGEMPQMPSGNQEMNGEMPQMPSGQMGMNNETTGTGSVSLTKGQTFEIVDADGNVVYTGTATRNADYIFYSSDSLKEGDTLTLKVNGSEALTATVGASAQSSGNTGFPGAQNGQNPTDAMTEAPSSHGSDTSSKPSSGQSGNSSASNNGQKKGKFKDVQIGAWYEEAVNYVTDTSLMNGVSDTDFAPDDVTTRGMFITVLYRLENSPKITGKIGFSDVADTAYYADAVKWGVDAGIVNGISDTAFAPDRSITREQMATMLTRYLKYKGVDTSADTPPDYKDASNVSDYAKESVSYAKKAGLLEGDENGNFLPKSNSTRAQIATVLMRLAKEGR